MAAVFLAPLYILINIYVVRWLILWTGACSRIFQNTGAKAALIGVYVFFAASLLTGFLIKKPLRLHAFLKKCSNYFLGVFTYILLVTIPADVTRLILKYGLHAEYTGGRTVFAIAGALCVLLILGISLYGIFHAKHIRVTPYEISLKKPVCSLKELKIVLFADTHFGFNSGARQAKKLAKLVNAQEPDLVCIAGDVFDNEFDAIDNPESVKNALKSIHSRYGTYACWGNHDLNEPILAGFTFKAKDKEGKAPEYDDPRMRALLEDAGITLLEDNSVLIDEKFYLIGRKDEARAEKINKIKKRPTPAQLIEKLDKNKPIFFLDHEPKELREIAAAGADLDLCGHTHAGQIFPGNLIIHLFWKNSCGCRQKGSFRSIVTSGAGVWGPAMRVGTDSEICVITVRFSSDT